MINVNKLKGKIVENGLSITELARKIGINRSTFYRKINDSGDTFSIKEANLIAKELNLTYEEVMSIFFVQQVA